MTDSRSASPYDFLRPIKLPREHLRTIQISYETFAHRMATLLTSSLRVVCRANLASIEQLSYEEHVFALANPTVLVPLSLDPLPGNALFELSLPTALSFIDHLLGGSGGPQPQRLLSDIETPLLRDLLDEILGELRSSLEPALVLTPKLGTLEYNPQLVQTSAGSDAVVVSYFELSIDDEQTAISLCVPLQSILPSLDRHRDQMTFSARERATRDAARETVSERLRDVPIGVSVRFRPVRLQPAQLLDLRPGDVVPLAHMTNNPLEITAAGQVFGHAVASRRGGQLACLVVDGPDSEVTPA